MYYPSGPSYGLWLLFQARWGSLLGFEQRSDIFKRIPLAAELRTVHMGAKVVTGQV